MKRNINIMFWIAVMAFIAVIAIGCTAAPGPVGPAGPAGPSGPVGKPGPLAPGTDTGMDVTVSMSKPANGTHFTTGEKATLTVTLKDKFGNSLTKDDFATLNLYIYGPQDPTKTVTAVKLLKAETDRAKTPHHYIDLLKDANVQVDGNTLKFALQPVASEDAGTYTTSVWAVKKGDPPVNQAFALADFQLGTATAEKQVIAKEKCANCHQGAANGQFYLHHVDPGRSPYGSPSIDAVPVRTCKACHNNDGYAAYTGDINNPTGPTNVRTPDPIIRRVHGVHMGEHLKNPFNTDPKTGNFKNYTGVLFPANVKDCTQCHVDDRWKTVMTRAACGACHDNVWFGEVAAMPKGFEAHKGNPQKDDAKCADCHTDGVKDLKSMVDAHKVDQKMNTIDVSLTAPKNGKFFVAGEKPTVTLVIKDDAGKPIDHTKVDETTFSTALFMVYGPRSEAKPVLTNIAKNGNSKARASASSSIAAAGTPTKGWTFEPGDTFKIAINGGAVQTIPAPAGLQTPDQVRDWLKGVLGEGVTVTSNNTAGSINMLSNVQGENSKFEIYNSPVTTKMGWKPGPLSLTRNGAVYGKTPGTTVEPFVVTGSSTIPGNDLRSRTDKLNYTDPLVTRSADKITYALEDVATVKPGTYMIYTYVVPSGVAAGTGAGPTGQPNAAAKALNVSRTGIGFTTFQVGTETPEKKIATNCESCHAKTIWHLDEGPIHAEPFDTDYCLACHDYNRSGTGDLFSRVGGNSTSGWAGYGAKPIAARVHNVHFGRYLTHPEWVYAGNPNAFSEVIFPQDVRNCTKCHSAETSGTWKTEPSRLACTGCHDSPAAISHAKLMTDNPNPSDPYDPRAVETCKACHGAGREFSPDKVHNISNPYKPPYPREPENR